MEKEDEDEEVNSDINNDDLTWNGQWSFGSLG